MMMGQRCCLRSCPVGYVKCSLYSITCPSLFVHRSVTIGHRSVAIGH